MYSNPSVQVDKGLGFGFSDVADFLKGAGTAALDIYKQNVAKKQQTAMYAQNVFPYGVPGVMPGVRPGGIPYQSSGMDWTTILLIGGVAIVGGIFLFKRK